jgi:hypothetical protein
MTMLMSLTINAMDTIRVSLKMPVTEQIPLIAQLDTGDYLSAFGGVKDTIFWYNDSTTTSIKHVLDTTTGFSHPITFIDVEGLKNIAPTRPDFFIGSLFVTNTLQTNLHNGGSITPNFANGSCDTLYYITWYEKLILTSNSFRISGQTNANRTNPYVIEEGESFKVGFNFNNPENFQFAKLYQPNGVIQTKTEIDSFLVTPTYTGVEDTLYLQYGNWQDTSKINKSIPATRVFYQVYKKFEIATHYKNKGGDIINVSGERIEIDGNELPIIINAKNKNNGLTKPGFSEIDNRWITKNTLVSETDTLKVTEPGEYVYSVKFDNKTYTKTYNVVIKQPATYTLSVVNGEIISPVGGKYTVGTSVSIKANIPTDEFYFSHWSSDYNQPFTNFENETTFTMPPSNVVLTANYCDNPVYTFNGNPVKDKILTIHDYHAENKLRVNGILVNELNEIIQDSINCFSVPELFSITHIFTNSCLKQFTTVFDVTVSNKYTGIETVSLGSVYGYNGKIFINLDKTTDVKIYNLTGSLVFDEKVQNKVIRFPRGLYIVVVDGITYKIIV